MAGPESDVEAFERRMRFRTRILRDAAAHGYSLSQRELANGDCVWSWATGTDHRLPAVFMTKLEAMRYMRDRLRDAG